MTPRAVRIATILLAPLALAGLPDSLGADDNGLLVTAPSAAVGRASARRAPAAFDVPAAPHAGAAHCARTRTSTPALAAASDVPPDASRAANLSPSSPRAARRLSSAPARGRAPPAGTSPLDSTRTSVD